MDGDSINFYKLGKQTAKYQNFPAQERSVGWPLLTSVVQLQVPTPGLL